MKESKNGYKEDKDKKVISLKIKIYFIQIL